MPDYRKLIDQLMSDNAAERLAARMLLVALGEHAADALIDALYNGVSDRHGIKILLLLGEIGGPDALNLLREVFDYDGGQRAGFKFAAAQGLINNIDALSPHEVQAVTRYLARINMKS